MYGRSKIKQGTETVFTDFCPIHFDLIPDFPYNGDRAFLYPSRNIFSMSLSLLQNLTTELDVRQSAFVPIFLQGSAADFQPAGEFTVGKIMFPVQYGTVASGQAAKPVRHMIKFPEKGKDSLMLSGQQPVHIWPPFLF